MGLKFFSIIPYISKNTVSKKKKWTLAMHPFLRGIQ